MPTTLELVLASQTEQLADGEQFLAATRANFVKPAAGFGALGLVAIAINERAKGGREIPIKDHMIWAVTDHRLLIWQADRVRNLKPTTFLGAAQLGTEAHDLQIDAGRKTTTLRLGLFGKPVTVKMPTDEATPVCEVLRRHVPPPAPRG
jgi:hypothetical protein